MAIAVKTATYPAAAGDVVVAHGLAEAPKAIIFFSTVTDGAGTWKANAEAIIGFWTPADGAKSVGIFGLDATGTSSESHYRATAAIATINSNPSFTVAADATNVTLTFANNYGSGKLLGMIVIAGPSVQAKIVRSTLKTSLSPNGIQAVTGVGFAPSVVLFAHGGDADTTEDANANGNRIGLGWMCADGTQGAGSTVATDNVSTSATERRASSGACLQGINSSGTVLFGAAFTSMDADGYTITYATAAANAAPYYALCLKGVTAKAITFAKKNGTGSQSVTTIGFPPQLVFFFGVNSGDGTSAANGGLSIGAASGTGSGGRFSTAFQMRNGLTSTDDNGYSNTHAVSIAAFGTSQALSGEADLSAFTSTGFNLNWVTNDTGVAPIFALGLRVPDWGGVLSDLATASDAIARATSDARALAEAAGATDAVARQHTAARSAAESAPSSDGVARVVAFPRAVTDTAGAAEALARASAFARAIADTGSASAAISSPASHPRAVADSAPAVDAVTRAAPTARAVADSAPASDAVVRAESSARLVGDSAPASSAASAQGSYGRAPADSAPAVDSLTGGHAAEAAISDSAPSSAAISRAVASARSAADSAPSSEAVTAAAAFGRQLADSAPASAAIVRAFGGGRGVADSGPSSEALASHVAFMRALVDVVNGVDVVTTTATHHVNRALADSVTGSDALSRADAAARALIDSAPAVDDLSGFVPSIYVPEPTDVAFVPSIDSAELVDSGTVATLTRSRTDAEIVRSTDPNPLGFGEGEFGEGEFGE